MNTNKDEWCKWKHLQEQNTHKHINNQRILKLLNAYTSRTRVYACLLVRLWNCLELCVLDSRNPSPMLKWNERSHGHRYRHGHRHSYVEQKSHKQNKTKKQAQLPRKPKRERERDGNLNSQFAYNALQTVVNITGQKDIFSLRILRQNRSRRKESYTIWRIWKFS